MLFRSLNRAAFTDAHGRFELSGLPDATVDLQVIHPDFVAMSLDHVPVGHPAGIALCSGARVRGLVTWRGEPAYRAFVRAGGVLSTTDAAGHFLLEHVPSSQDLSVEVTAYGGSVADMPESRRATRTITAVDGQDIMLAIELLEGATLRGRVTHTGRPVAGGEVALELTVAQATCTPMWELEGEIAADGSFELAGVRPGPAELHVTIDMEDESLEATRRIEVPVTGVLQIDVDVP